MQIGCRNRNSLCFNHLIKGERAKPCTQGAFFRRFPAIFFSQPIESPQPPPAYIVMGLAFTCAYFPLIGPPSSSFSCLSASVGASVARAVLPSSDSRPAFWGLLGGRHCLLCLRPPPLWACFRKLAGVSCQPTLISQVTSAYARGPGGFVRFASGVFLALTPFVARAIMDRL